MPRPDAAQYEGQRHRRRVGALGQVAGGNRADPALRTGTGWEAVHLMAGCRPPDVGMLVFVRLAVRQVVARQVEFREADVGERRLVADCGAVASMPSGHGHRTEFGTKSRSH